MRPTLGREEEEMARHGDPQGDDARVLEDDPRRGPRRRPRSWGTSRSIWQGPQKEDDRSEQIKLVQNAVASGVDGIVLAPLDAKALVEPVEAGDREGNPGGDHRLGPRVVEDRQLRGDGQLSRRGARGADGSASCSRGKGKIILLRYAVGSESTEQREKGFTDTIEKEFPKITYPVGRPSTPGPTSDSAQQKAQNLVTRYRGQIDGVFCPNESSTSACSGR